MRTALACLLCLLAPALAAAQPPARTVVLMLYDGFGGALLSQHATPAFQRIEREGAFTRRLEPVFPSISLTNQTTISTAAGPSVTASSATSSWTRNAAATTTI